MDTQLNKIDSMSEKYYKPIYSNDIIAPYWNLCARLIVVENGILPLRPCGWYYHDHPFRFYNCCDFSCECGLHNWADHSSGICPPFLCKGNVQHFIYSKLDAADCAQLVLNDDLETVL